MLIRCLGTIGVQHRDGITSLTRAQRRIMAILTAAGPDGLSSAAFADELYGEDLPAQWEASVRQAIKRMRKALPLNTIVTRSGRYALEVDHTEIDVWKLLRFDPLGVASEPADQLAELLTGEAFPDVELTPMLQEQREAIVAARTRLVTAMAEHQSSWPPNVLVAARALARNEHYRDDLLAAVIRLHRAHGSRPGGRLLVEQATGYLRAEMQAELGALSSAAASALAGETDLLPPDDRAEPTGFHGDPYDITPRRVGVFDNGSTAGLIDRPTIAARVQALLNGPGVVVRGDSGAGKSALVRSFVLPSRRHERPEGHVLWLNGRRGTPSAYEPFIAAMPALATDLAPVLEDGGTDLQRIQCWAAVRRRLDAEFPHRRLTIVVDDAHWLDSHSQRLVTFLATATVTPASPSLIVIGRNDAATRDWQHFSLGLIEVGLGEVDLGEFGHDELVELVGLHHPASTSKQRHDLATSLRDRRAALPAVAHELVRTADPATLALGTGTMEARRPDIWTERVGPASRRVGAIAAVIGMRFRVPEVAALGALGVAAVVAALDDLLDADLVVPEERPDEFSFRHVLIHADFDEVLDRGERRRLHLEASRLASAAGDVHAHAIHLVESGAMVENERVVAALLDSAREFERHGSFREAVEAYTSARRLSVDELAVHDLLAFAEATATSGGDGWELRSAAFERARAEGDADLCLDVALSGVLRTEDAMGQPRRVEMLEQIDADALSSARRAEHAAALARELGLLGRHDEAIATVTEALERATSPTEALVAWLGAWASCRALPPDRWPALPEERHRVEEPELVSRVAQIECARALVVGDDEFARRRLRDFAEHPFTRADPLRRWHAGLVEAAFAFVDGRWEDHRRQADITFAEASSAGVTAAFSTRFAQEFVIQWLTRRHGALLAEFEAAPPDVGGSFLAESARAITLAEHGRYRTKAAELIAGLAERVHGFRSPLAPAAAALLASAPVACRPNDTTRLLRDVLLPFRNSALVAGAVLAHLGPGSWSLANLADTTDERIALLEQACAQADDWNLPAWAVVCRRDLAAASGAAAPLREATEIAAGTPLELLL